LKLLFDQNLSRKLVNRLADMHPDASHVQFHDLTDADDSAILDCLELY
jgi:predicted nuclease of predicted toxin-antitoxin system